MISPAGNQISETIRIESVEQLSDVLREANDSGTPVLPIGGGTFLSTGKPVDHPFIALDLSGLSGVVDYVPTDMTAGFLAGTPMSVVTETLAANGQELPVDLPPDDAGTIGGLVATGFASPRRYSQGTLKDLLIGCEYVRGDGLVAKAGGMTVKNVSGFEISRLLHGSWGSLAVLTRVNLKVLPKPRCDRTLTWHDSDVKAAIDRQMRLLLQFPGAVALQTSQHGDDWRTSIRFAGRESGVEDYVRQASEIEGAPDAAEDPASVWGLSDSVDAGPQLVLSENVSSLQRTVLDLAESDMASGLTWSFNTGTLRAEIDPAGFDPAMISSTLWMIEGGDTDFRTANLVWGPARADHTIMRSVKQQFDPKNILNRGRLFV